MSHEHPDHLKLGLNLKNAMEGPAIHIPYVFYVDKRLTATDREFIGTLLTLVKEDGGLMPTTKELQRVLGCSAPNVTKRKERLWKFGYLCWEPLEEDRRRLCYELSLPYDSDEWIKSLRWQQLFEKAEDFMIYLRSLLEGVIPEELVNQKETNILLLLSKGLKSNNNNSRSKLVNQKETKFSPRYKKKKPDRRKPKNGRKEDKDLQNRNSIFYEDDPNATHHLITTYITWVNRQAGGNGGNKFFRIDRNSPNYRHFVKLRKRLLEFRGDHKAPEVQKLFWDFFRIIGKLHSEWGYTKPFIKQLASDKTWIHYASYISDNYPSGTYWIPSY